MSLMAARVGFWARAKKLDANELIEFWSERAAIREYLGGQSRKDAEHSALSRDVPEQYDPEFVF